MTAITIEWRAGFGYPLTDDMRADLAEQGIPETLTLTFDLNTEGIEEDRRDERIAERVFRETNLYEGPWWRKIEAALPAVRHHTALSVGDIVTIEGRALECAPLGWKRLEDAR